MYGVTVMMMYVTCFGKIDHIARNKRRDTGGKSASTLFLTKVKSLCI